jgi:hypothetical protein
VDGAGHVLAPGSVSEKRDYKAAGKKLPAACRL